MYKYTGAIMKEAYISVVRHRVLLVNNTLFLQIFSVWIRCIQNVKLLQLLSVTMRRCFFKFCSLLVHFAIQSCCNSKNPSSVSAVCLRLRTTCIFIYILFVLHILLPDLASLLLVLYCLNPCYISACPKAVRCLLLMMPVISRR